jgi:hypothetical protein
VGEDNKAQDATIGWGDTTETVMLNFSIEGTGDVVTIDFINITHGGNGDIGDCRVYIYNETGTTPGTLDGGETLLNTGGTQLSGDDTQIDVTDMNIGANFKTYLLITLVLNTDVSDVGEDHFINITAAKDFQLTSTQDSITGSSFPLTGGPIEIIPEFPDLFIPLLGTVTIFLASRRYKSKKKKPVIL